MATRVVKERTYQRLLVLLPPHRVVAGGARTQLSSSTAVSFVAIDGEGRAERGDGPFPLLPKARQTDLVFDSADVFGAEIDAPALSDAKLRQALPNLLEDRLLSDAADCHFAFGTRAESGKLPVAVIDRGLLTRALDACQEGGIKPRAAYSEIYTVAAPTKETLCLRAERERGIARTAAHEGFAFDLESSPPPALALAARRGVRQIHAYGRDAARLAAFSPALGVPVEVKGDGFDLAADAVNLLQGSFGTGGLLPGLPRVSWSSLRAPLAWAAVAAATFVIGMNVYWLRLEGERSDIRQSMQAAFKAAFPRLDDDPELAIEQTKRELRTLRARAGQASPTDFSALNAQLAQLMSAAPLGAVAGIEYRDGALRVKFRPEAGTDPGLQNLLRAQTAPLGLSVRFDPDGSARITVAGS